MFIFTWLSNHKLQTNAELILFGILIFMIIIFFIIGIIWSIYNIVIKTHKIKNTNKKSGYCPKQCRIKTVEELMHEQHNEGVKK